MPTNLKHFDSSPFVREVFEVVPLDGLQFEVQWYRSRDLGLSFWKHPSGKLIRLQLGKNCQEAQTVNGFFEEWVQWTVIEGLRTGRLEIKGQRERFQPDLILNVQVLEDIKKLLNQYVPLEPQTCSELDSDVSRQIIHILQGHESKNLPGLNLSFERFWTFLCNVFKS